MVWRGGPRSHRSYRMDYYRQSKLEKDSQKKGSHGITSVKPHYSKTADGTTKVVNAHLRHY